MHWAEEHSSKYYVKIGNKNLLKENNGDFFKVQANLVFGLLN